MITPNKSKKGLAAACLTALMAILPARADYQSTVASYNPLGYWRFNETATAPPFNTVANSSAMGSALTGLVIADVEKGQAGIVGNAARLHNTGVAAGYLGSKIDVPFNPALNKSGAFSVECWVKPAALGADATGMAILSSMMNDFVASGRRGYLMYINNAGRFEFRLGNSGGYVGTVNNGAVPAANAKVGEWSHVVGVFNGTQTKILVNGVEVASATLTAAQIASLEQNTQMPFRIGGTPFNGSLSSFPGSSSGGVSGNRGFDGTVDEVAYYSFAMTPAQALAHYNTAKNNPGEYSGAVLGDNPVGYWPLDDAAVTPPDPSTFPTVANSGSLGSALDGKVFWGGLTAQPGSGYAGLGATDKAITLDGANGFVKLPNDPGLDITGAITMMAWIKPNQKNFFRDIIARGWNADQAETFLRISRGTDFNGSGFGTTNHYELGTTDSNAFYDNVLIPMPDGDVGNWVFIAGTFDGAKWTLYRNGKEIGSVDSENGPRVLAMPWSIGAQSGTDTGTGPQPAPTTGGNSSFFPGSIDEPAIFDTALSAADIAAIYAAAQVTPVITKSVASPNGYRNSTYGALFQGGSVELSVWAEGSEPLSYAWYKDGTPLGVTTTNLPLSNLAQGNPVYAVVVTNPYGKTTNSVTLNIQAAPPTFTTQPVSLARFAGSPFTFTVATGGSTPQTYQWKTNGVDIAGATGLSYTGTASEALNGVNFTVVASNSAGNKESNPGKVSVLPAAKDYTAAVLSQAPVAFYRLGEPTGTTAFDYIGNNNGSYLNVTLGVDGYSAIDSDKAAAFLGPNSYIGLDGAALSFSGTTASFTLEAWVKGAEGQVDETSIISKGTGSDGTTANEQFALDISGGHYRLLTRGNNNVVYSADASVGPNGTWQHIVAVYDQSVAGSPEMRIYVNGELSGTGAGRPAGLRASTAVVAIGSKRLGNAPIYDGTFNGSIDEVAFYNAPLSEAQIQAHYGAAYGTTTRPQFAVRPKATTNYVTLKATFTASSFGSVPLSYQWRKGTTDLPGENGQSLTVGPLAPGDEADYSVTVSNGVGSTNSGPAHLTVLAAPTAPPTVPGLVVHLPFDSNLTDATGRGNNGTAITQTSTSSNVVAASFIVGKLGDAVHYESNFGEPGAPGATTTTNTSYVSLGVRNDLQFGTDTNFTIAFWIKLPENFVGGDLPIFTTTVGSLGGQGIVLAPAYGFGIGSGSNPDPSPANYGGWAVSLYDSGAANGARIYGDVGSINDGQWHHLTYVFDRANQVVTYLDGAVAKSFKISGTTTAAAGTIDTGAAAIIGQDPTGLYQETGAGDVDDFGVWRRALTPLEVASIYVAGNNNLSYTGGSAPSTISITQSGADLTITWTGGVLQSADALFPLSFTDVAGATSPRTVTPAGAAKFYRVKGN